MRRAQEDIARVVLQEVASDMKRRVSNWDLMRLPPDAFDNLLLYEPGVRVWTSWTHSGPSRNVSHHINHVPDLWTCH